MTSLLTVFGFELLVTICLFSLSPALVLFSMPLLSKTRLDLGCLALSCRGDFQVSGLSENQCIPAVVAVRVGANIAQLHFGLLYVHLRKNIRGKEIKRSGGQEVRRPGDQEVRRS